MKYYKDTNNNLYANPSNLDGLAEVESAVRADGTLLPKHKKLCNFETKEDGSYYKYYNQNGTPDLVKIEKELLEEDKATQIAEAKEYLTDTDFYFSIDKYATLSEERRLELNTLRAEARVLINSLEG